MSVGHLIAHWRSEWDAAYPIAYEPAQGDRAAFEAILEDFGLDVAKRAISALLRSEQLAWVTHRRPAWLANPANRSYVAPALAAPTGSQEWTGKRDTTTTITVRKRGRAAC